MCSAIINRFVSDQLEDKKHANDHQLIENRFFKMADQADTDNPGALDDLSHSMMGMPAELRDAKKVRIGRHRVFYTGRHSQCQYQMFYIKWFKKAGTEDENDKKFQDKLKRLIDGPAHRELTNDED